MAVCVRCVRVGVAPCHCVHATAENSRETDMAAIPRDKAPTTPLSESPCILRVLSGLVSRCSFGCVRGLWSPVVDTRLWWSVCVVCVCDCVSVILSFCVCVCLCVSVCLSVAVSVFESGFRALESHSVSSALELSSHGLALPRVSHTLH